jgi:AcrR family transcriptional regulator
MPGNFKREDLRILKTQKALFTALETLLRRTHFSKITVYDICTEALVSRTAFYAHFSDKYDLLEQSMQPLHHKLMSLFCAEDGAELEDYTYRLLRAHAALLINVLEDADRDMLMLLFRFFSPTPELWRHGGRQDKEQAVIISFLGGGLVNCLLAQLRALRSTDEAALRNNISCAYRLVHDILFQNAVR